MYQTSKRQCILLVVSSFPMLPNLSELRVARSKRLEPRVAQIGVYTDSPPDSIRLGLSLNAPAALDEDALAFKLFDALGPCIGVELRIKMYNHSGMTYELSREDQATRSAFQQAFRVWTFSSIYEFRYDLSKEALRYAVILLADLRHRSVPFGAVFQEALYELHIYYMRYVWNFRLPESDAPIDYNVQKEAWSYLNSVFSYLQMFYLARSNATEASLDQPNATTFFTRWGTPLIKFPNFVMKQDILYEMLTAYWSAQARLRWNTVAQKAMLMNRMNQIWTQLYLEQHFKPGSEGFLRAREEFERAVPELEFKEKHMVAVANRTALSI